MFGQERARQHRHVLARHQFVGRGLRVRRLAAVILGDDDELLAVDAAGGVDLLDRELPALAIGLGERRQQRIAVDLADLDLALAPARRHGAAAMAATAIANPAPVRNLPSHPVPPVSLQRNYRNPSSPLTSSTVSPPTARQRPAAVGDRNRHHDLVGARRIVDLHFHAVEMAAHEGCVLVAERNIERGARAARASSTTGSAPRPCASTFRTGAPIFGCRIAAACSSSPFSPTAAALP